MDGLIKIIATKHNNWKDKTDAYLTITQHLMSDPNAAEQTLNQHMSSILPLLKVHIGVKMKLKDVSLAALKILGQILGREKLVSKADKSILADILTGLCNLLNSEKDKQFYINSFWCFAHCCIPAQILSKYVATVVSCFTKHSSSGSLTVMKEGLYAIKRLSEICPDEMEDEIQNCIDAIFIALESKLFSDAVDVVIVILPFLLKKYMFFREYVAKQLHQQGFGQKIVKYYNDGTAKVPWIKLWSCFAKLFGETFFQLESQVRNSTFMVMTNAFKKSSTEIQFALYDFWVQLIDAVVAKPDDIDKRLKILLQPLKTLYHCYDNPDNAEKCLKTYWYFICKIGGKINENIEKVVLPILEALFSRTKDAIKQQNTAFICVTPSKSSTTATCVETPKNTTMDAKIATPKTPKVPSSSLPRLKLLTVEMLYVLLSTPDERKNLKGTKLEPFFGPQISPENLFKHSSRFVGLLSEATKSSSNDMVNKTWVLFLLEIQNIASNAIDAKRVWCNIFSVFKVIIDDEFGNADLILRIVSIAPPTGSYKELICEGNEKGFPALFFIQTLLHEKFIKAEIYENERFFVLYQAMIEVLFNGVSDQLACAGTIFQCLMKVKGFINEGVSWRLWSTLSHCINGYVSLTNEVNQGTAAKYEFDVVLKSLLYPLKCIDVSKLMDGEKSTLMETWSELYETFERAISLLPGVQDNLIIGELCKATMEHCTRDVRKSLDLIIKMLWMVVKSETFDLPSTKFGLVHGAYFGLGRIQENDEQPVGNFTHFVQCLKVLVTKVLGENQSQGSRNADKHLLEIIEIIQYFFEQLNSYAELYEAMDSLNQIILDLFAKSASSKLINYLVKLMDSIFSAFENASKIEYDSSLLQLFEPLLIKLAASNRTSMRLRCVQFWNNTFGKNGALIYSDMLKNNLVNCKTPVKPIFNGNTPSVSGYDEDAQFPDSLDSASNETPKKKPSLTSPAKVIGSFLHTCKNLDQNSSPIKLDSFVKSPAKLKARLFSPEKNEHSPLHSAKKSSRRKSKANKTDDDFVEIKEAPKKSRLLTEHQKEVMREKKLIPLMYNSLDQSQDTQLFQSYTQDTSNSQTKIESVSSGDKQVFEVIPSTDGANVDFEKFSATPSTPNDKEDGVDKEQNPTLVKMSPCEEDEDNSVIPSSQTQESFSQLRSPFVENANQPILAKVAESPEEHLTSVTTFHGLLQKEEKSDKNEVREEIHLGKLKSNIFESNKENALLDDIFSKSPSENGPVAPVTDVTANETALNNRGNQENFKTIKPTDWLSANSADKLGKQISNRVLKATASPIVKTALIKDLNENISDDIKLIDLFNQKVKSGKRKRKSQVIGEKRGRKKIKKEDHEMAIVKTEPDVFDFVSTEKVIVQNRTDIKKKQVKKHPKKSKSPQKTAAVQKNNMYNFLKADGALQTDVAPENAQFSFENQDLSIEEKSSNSENATTMDIMMEDDTGCESVGKTDESNVCDMLENIQSKHEKAIRKGEEKVIINKEPAKTKISQTNDDCGDLSVEHVNQLLEDTSKTNMFTGSWKPKEYDIAVGKERLKADTVFKMLMQEDNIIPSKSVEDSDITIIDTNSCEHNTVINSDPIAPNGALSVSSDMPTLKEDNSALNPDLLQSNEEFSCISSNSDNLNVNSSRTKDCVSPSTSIVKPTLNDLPIQNELCLSPTNICKSGSKSPETVADPTVEMPPEEIKNPFISTLGISPIRGIPSPNASPVNGILKKRTCFNQSPSPPFKNRRVSFQLPEGTSALKEDEEKEKSTLLCNKPKKQKTKSPAPSCIYPELVNCSAPIERILPSITLSRGVGNLVRAQNIKTVGDLCSLSEAQVENLPLRSPKLRTVRNALRAFSTQQPRVRATSKSPLSMESLNLLGFSSPRKSIEGDKEEASLLATPSKQRDAVKPIMLFHDTPIKEEPKSPLLTAKEEPKSPVVPQEEVLLESNENEKYISERTEEIDVGSLSTEKTDELVPMKSKQLDEKMKSRPSMNVVKEVFPEPAEKTNDHIDTPLDTSKPDELHVITRPCNSSELIDINIHAGNDQISPTEMIPDVSIIKTVDSTEDIKGILEQTSGLAKRLLDKVTRRKSCSDIKKIEPESRKNDLNASFRFPSADDSFENPFADIHRLGEISPIKKERIETHATNDSFVDESDDTEEILRIKNENVVDESIISDSIENAEDVHMKNENLPTELHNDDDIENTSVCFPQMEGISPIKNDSLLVNVCDESFEKGSVNIHKNISSKMDNNKEQKTSSTISKCGPSVTIPSVITPSTSVSTSVTEQITPGDIEPIPSSCNVTIDYINNKEVDSLEMLRNIDLKRLPTTGIFDLVNELDGLKAKAMAELKSRMLSHH